MKNKHTGWYKKAKNISSLKKESDLDWKGVGKGLGMGALLSTLPLNSGMMAGTNLPNNNTSINTTNTGLSSNNKKQDIKNEDKPVQKEPEISKKPQEDKQTKTVEKSNSPSLEELENFIAPFEGGYIGKAYKDSKGIWTIGVGFNLQRQDADKILASIGASKKELIAGRQTLNKSQMSALFKENLKTAINDAHSWIPNLSSLPKEVQLICIDMSFNMGGPTLRTFINTGQKIKAGKFSEAADLLETSRWYKQVGNRSKHHVSVLRKLENN